MLRALFSGSQKIKWNALACFTPVKNMMRVFECTEFVLTLLFAGAVLQSCGAQQKINTIDVSEFSDSKHHWMDITDHEQVIMPEKNQVEYKPGDVRGIADNILLYQQPNGGWPKNYNMLAILTNDQKKVLALHKDSLHTTIDNGATYAQIEYLAKAYMQLNDERYKNAALHGIYYLLEAQYDNGGWPQFYPDTTGYRKYITFNDGAMIGVMNVLHEIVEHESYFNFIDDALRNDVVTAYNKGIDCILKCQILETDKLTVWCQQHDNITLKPTNARAFELASKASSESVGVVRFLMKVDKPSDSIINAVKSAVAWFEKVAIVNTRVEEINIKPDTFQFHVATKDRVVVTDTAAPPIWTRYYMLKTDRPMFANRDGKVVYSLSEVTEERRTGYAWYGYWPAKLLEKDYPKWAAKLTGQ